MRGNAVVEGCGCLNASYADKGLSVPDGGHGGCTVRIVPRNKPAVTEQLQKATECTEN